MIGALTGTFQAIAMLLAVRLLLLLSIIAAFMLGRQTTDWLGFAVFAAFCGLIVIPLIWLDTTTRRVSK